MCPAGGPGRKYGLAFLWKISSPGNPKDGRGGSTHVFNQLRIPTAADRRGSLATAHAGMLIFWWKCRVIRHRIRTSKWTHLLGGCLEAALHEGRSKGLERAGKQCWAGVRVFTQLWGQEVAAMSPALKGPRPPGHMGTATCLVRVL